MLINFASNLISIALFISASNLLNFLTSSLLSNYGRTYE